MLTTVVPVCRPSGARLSTALPVAELFRPSGAGRQRARWVGSRTRRRIRLWASNVQLRTSNGGRIRRWVASPQQGA